MDTKELKVGDPVLMWDRVRYRKMVVRRILPSGRLEVGFNLEGEWFKTFNPNGLERTNGYYRDSLEEFDQAILDRQERQQMIAQKRNLLRGIAWSRISDAAIIKIAAQVEAELTA